MTVFALAFGSTVATASAAAMPAPADLKQTAASASSVSLSWKSVSKAPKYRLQISTSASMSSATYVRVSGTSTTLKSLKPGKRYYVKVRVITTSGGNLGPYSAAPVSMWTGFGVPTGLASKGSTPGRADLAWSAVAGAPHYRIQLSRSSSMSSATYHRFGATTGQISGLTPGATYYARVRVITADGVNLGSYTSKPISFKVAAAPSSATAPTGLVEQGTAASMVSLGWKATTAATHYLVQVSTSAQMTSPVARTVTAAHAQVGGLRAGQKYYAQVKQVTATGGSVSGFSPAITFTLPTSDEFGLTAPQGLSVAKSSATSAQVTWDSTPAAPRYRVQVAGNAQMSGATYVRSTGDATSLTLPDLKPNTTYFAKVRVITADGGNVSAYSPAIEVRTTAAAPSPLNVASFNIKCHSCLTAAADRSPEEKSWYERRDTVVSTILSRKPDVIGVQEAAQSWLKDSSGKSISLSQFEDLNNRLRSAGGNYQLSNANRNNCVKSTTPTSCSYKDQGASQGTRIIYNADEVSLVRQGSKLLPGCSGCNGRYLAWAELVQKDSGQHFFFGTVHLEPGKTRGPERIKQAQTAVAEIAAKNTGNLPEILVGDFNHTMWSDASMPKTAWDLFLASGLKDPLGHVKSSAAVAAGALAEQRVHANYNSYGDFARNQKRYAENQNGSNLDYILVSPMRVLRWETVVQVDGNGDISSPIVPSDHNMLSAQLLFPPR